MTPEQGELQRRLEFQIGEPRALGDYLQPTNDGIYAFLPIPITVEGIGEGEILFPLFDLAEPLSKNHVVSTPYDPIITRTVIYNAPPHTDPASLPFRVEVLLKQLSPENETILVQLFANGKIFKGENDSFSIRGVENKLGLQVVSWYENDTDTLLLFPQNSDAKTIELQFGQLFLS